VRTVKLLLALAAALLMAAALSIVTTTPAQADVWSCTWALSTRGYAVTGPRTLACQTGAAPHGYGFWACVSDMVGTGVNSDISAVACRRASSGTD
jgi:hypothetical protein